MRSDRALSTIVICLLCISIFSIALPQASAAKPADVPPVSLASTYPTDYGYFGSAVAIGDGYVVVGGQYETSGGYSYAGNVYVFNATDGAYMATLTSPSPAEDGAFGISVAISGKRVAVGAPNEDVGGIAGAGNAYVFTTSGKLSKTLASPNAAEDGFFGYSVAMDGKSVVVGACCEPQGGVMSGNAFVFSTSGRLSKTLVGPSPVDSGYFGFAVSVDGGNVAVGACYESSGGIAAGSAYIFG